MKSSRIQCCDARPLNLILKRNRTALVSSPSVVGHGGRVNDHGNFLILARILGFFIGGTKSAKMSLAVLDIVLKAIVFAAIFYEAGVATPLFVGCLCFHVVCIMNMTSASGEPKALNVGLVPLALAGIIFSMVFILACTDEDMLSPNRRWRP